MKKTIILWLVFMLVATSSAEHNDINKLWLNLSETKGCLIFATNINSSIEGSIFEDTKWQNFIKEAKSDANVFNFLINLFPSQNPTNIHICNFENATEGLLAVFVVQQVTQKNWTDYDGNNLSIIQEIKGNKFPEYRSLKKILSYKNTLEELQKFFLNSKDAQKMFGS